MTTVSGWWLNSGVDESSRENMKSHDNSTTAFLAFLLIVGIPRSSSRISKRVVMTSKAWMDFDLWNFYS